jgi:hypothetical protein
MLTKQCETCAKDFRPDKRGTRFCSSRCYGASRRGKRQSTQQWLAATSATPRGPASRLWKGTEASYSVIHSWVRRTWGRAVQCDMCHRESGARFEWANISREYRRERSDWMQLCRSCHNKYDRSRSLTHCRQGHEFSPEITYTNPTTGHRACKICRRAAQQRRKASR